MARGLLLEQVVEIRWFCAKPIALPPLSSARPSFTCLITWPAALPSSTPPYIHGHLAPPLWNGRLIDNVVLASGVQRSDLIFTYMMGWSPWIHLVTICDHTRWLQCYWLHPVLLFLGYAGSLRPRGPCTCQDALSRSQGAIHCFLQASIKGHILASLMLSAAFSA